MACERLHFSMHSHVILKVFIESETPFTLFTFERLLFRVNNYMPVSLFSLWEIKRFFSNYEIMIFLFHYIQFLTLLFQWQ